MPHCQISDSLVVPTPTLVENLGPGCFVLVERDDGRAWVEITVKEPGYYKGVIHQRLKVGMDNKPVIPGDVLIFGREQIKNLGCDHFCFC